MNTGQAAPGYEPRGTAAGRPGAADPDAACEIETDCAARAGHEADVPCGAEADGETCAEAGTPAARPMMTCRAREVLQRVGDKWSVLAIDLLGQGTMRFTELHRAIDGITARMLTVTLRGLERDGIVSRTMYPVISVSWFASSLWPVPGPSSGPA